jgi:ATP-dependent DNA ligase
MMKKFRVNPPKEIAGSPVVVIKDYQFLQQNNLLTGVKWELDFPESSNVLQFFTEDGTKISVRPSGTEPKIKFYIEVRTKMNTRADYESAEAFAQEKIDGFWYQFEKTENYYYLFSRTVSAKNNLLVEKSANVPHLVNFLNERLPKNTIIVGEIYYPNKTSKDVTTIMGCDSPKAIARQEENPLHYYIHDIIYYDGVNLLNTKAELRYKILSKIWEKHNLGDSPYLRLAD